VLWGSPEPALSWQVELVETLSKGPLHAVLGASPFFRRFMIRQSFRRWVQQIQIGKLPMNEPLGSKTGGIDRDDHSGKHLN